MATFKDDIDFSSAVMAAPDSPDIRTWAIGSQIDRVHLAPTPEYVRGNLNIWFDRKDSLIPAFGSQGPISWTVWLGCSVSGRWDFAPIVECINDDYVPTGDLFAPNQIGKELLYYPNAPLRGYQPASGEPIAFVVTTGDTRRQNAQATGQDVWRTNVVVVPFRPGMYTFTRPETPVVVPPVVPPAPGGGTVALEAAIVTELGKITSRLDVIEDYLRRVEYRGEGSLGPLRGVAVLKPTLPDAKKAA